MPIMRTVSEDAAMMSDILTSDKRMQSWLNEGSVLLALTKNNNQPAYVSKIARLAPEMTRSSKKRKKSPKKAAKSKKNQDGGGTKPGMKAAAERLRGRGILVRTEAIPPNKKTMTPHYSVVPSLEVLATILRTYGSWVVGDMMRTGFTSALVEGGMDGHLSKVLEVPVEDVQRLPKALKDELSYLARSSPKALEVFLSPQFELKPTVGLEKGAPGLVAQIRRLRDTMVLAFIAEAASSPGLRIWEKGWDVDADVSAVITSGSMSIHLRATFDSKRFRRAPSDPDVVHREHKARRDAARAEPSS